MTGNYSQFGLEPKICVKFAKMQYGLFNVQFLLLLYLYSVIIFSILWYSCLSFYHFKDKFSPSSFIKYFMRMLSYLQKKVRNSISLPSVANKRWILDQSVDKTASLTLLLTTVCLCTYLKSQSRSTIWEVTYITDPILLSGSTAIC